MIQGNTSYKALSSTPGGPPGPPFLATAADNGLSVDAVSGRIVLGNDFGGTGAELLSNREIEMLNNSFQILNLGGPQFIIDQANRQYGFGDIGILLNGTHLLIDDQSTTILFSTLIGGVTTPAFAIDGANSLYRFGDLNNANNGTKLEIDDTVRQVRIETDVQRYLFTSPQVYGFGDLLGFFNGSQIGIDDFNAAFDFQTILNGHLFNISGISGNASLGDLDFNTSGFQMFLDYANQHLSVLTGAFPGNRLFDINNISGVYALGDLDAAGNGLQFELDNSTTKAEIRTPLGGMFSLDQANGLYDFGDISGGAGNGNRISLDDTGSQLLLDNTALNLGIQINGVPGFTGTVTPVVSITVNNGIVTNVA